MPTKSLAGAVGATAAGDNHSDVETAHSGSVESLLSRDLRERSALFQGVTAAQMAELRSVCHERRFAPGELILREGLQDPFVYVLIDGVAHVTKNTSMGGGQMRMAELRSGDVLGELKIVELQPSSASVVAATHVTALAMDLDVFADSAALTAVRATLLRNAGKILAAKLRATTSEGADGMQRELDESRARVHAGRFIVLMFAMMATYQLAISALVLVPNSVRPSTSILSFIFVIWAVVPVVLSFQRSPFSRQSYGLTMQQGGSVAVQALIWTMPLLLLVLVFKIVLTRWAFPMADQPLFDPTALFAGRPFNTGFYLFAICIYVIHAPAQELVVRSGLQGTLQNFIPTKPGHINWKAIIISNLLFAAPHAFIGFWFCVAVFVPGLFWGWMFATAFPYRGRSVPYSGWAVGNLRRRIAIDHWWVVLSQPRHAVGWCGRKRGAAITTYARGRE